MQSIFHSTNTKDNLSTIIDFIKLLQQQNNYTKKPINIILLKGEVGMGKSHLVHEYNNEIFHYDLYLKNDEYAMMRLYESLANKGLHFIEWGSETLYLQLQNMGFSCILLEILPTDNTNTRDYNFLI